MSSPVVGPVRAGGLQRLPSMGLAHFMQPGVGVEFDWQGTSTSVPTLIFTLMVFVQLIIMGYAACVM
ncbi:hypothetical protein ACVWWQ_000768 [Rhodanobacter sp. TND4EL1]